MKAPKIKRRAIELFARNSPFRQKVVQVKTRYQRNPKHRSQEA
jgi:hypothetical protein